MLLHRSLGLAAIAAILGLVSSANAQFLTQNFSLTGAASTMSQTTSGSLPLGTGYAWTVNLTSVNANGFLFGQSIPLPINAYGTNPSDLSSGGIYSGNAAGTLWSHRYTFTDFGGVSPAYDFTLSLKLNADQTLSTSVVMNSLGSFTAGGITTSPFDVPVTSVDVVGTAQATALIPAPGSTALIAVGSLLVMRRRRPSKA